MLIILIVRVTFAANWCYDLKSSLKHHAEGGEVLSYELWCNAHLSGQNLVLSELKRIWPDNLTGASPGNYFKPCTRYAGTMTNALSSKYFIIDPHSLYLRLHYNLVFPFIGLFIILVFSENIERQSDSSLRGLWESSLVHRSRHSPPSLFWRVCPPKWDTQTYREELALSLSPSSNKANCATWTGWKNSVIS